MEKTFAKSLGSFSSAAGGGGGGDSVIKDYEAPSYTTNTTLFASPLPIPNLDALTEAGTYRVHFDMDIEGTTTTVTYIADVAPIKVSDTLFAYMQNLYVGPGGGDSVSIVRSGALDGGSITWADWSGNSVADINTNLAKKLENTATGTNSLTILGQTSTGLRTINIGANSQAPRQEGIAIGVMAFAEQYGLAIGSGQSGDFTWAKELFSIAIGHGARSTAQYAIQIGYGTNSSSKTLSVGLDLSHNYELLNSAGKIPMARLPIVQLTQADYDALVAGGTVDANTIYCIIPA